MKKDQPAPPENHSSNLSDKSFSVAFEQMAKLLRREVKMKDRTAKVLLSNSLPESFALAFRQIAKLLRSEVPSSKKRIWTKHSSKRKD